MHQDINKSRHQQGLCMRISASKIADPQHKTIW